MKLNNLFKIFLIVFTIFMFSGIVSATEIGAGSFKTKFVGDGQLHSLGTLNGVYSYTGDGPISAPYYNYETEDETPLYCLHQGLEYCAGCTYNKVATYTANRDNPTGYGCVVINIKASGGDINNRAVVQTAFWQRNLTTLNCSGSIDSIRQSTKKVSSRKEPYYGEWNDPTSGIQKNVLKFEKSSYNLHLDQNNSDYYITDAINITATKAYNINSTLPKGGYLTTSSSCTGKNLVSGSTSEKKIYACIPVNSDFKNTTFGITISGNYNISATCTRTAYSGEIKYSCQTPSASVYEYSKNESGFQSLVMFNYSTSEVACGTETIPAGKDTTKDCSIEDNHNESTTLVVPLGSIKINKTDSRTKKPVGGAKFRLYRQNNNKKYVEVTSDAKGNKLNIVTDSNGKFEISNLIYGTYKLVEYEPAVGYEKNEVEATGIVIDNTKPIPVNITNTPISTLISKQDISNEKELPGAHISVTNEYNELILEFISGKEPKKFYLGQGKYTITETASPEGYEKMETVFEFEVLESGDIKLLNVKNDKNIKVEKNKIILYNTPIVDVPDTAKSSYIYPLVGGFVTILGVLIVYSVIKKSKNKNEA